MIQLPVAIQMGLYTGLREGDIAQLEWDELRVHEGVLILQPNKTKRWGGDRSAVHTLDAPWVKLLPARPPEPAKGYVWPQAAARAASRSGIPGFREICEAAGVETERAPAAAERRKKATKPVAPKQASGRGKMSPAARKRISEMMKKRWAERRKKAAKTA